MIPLNSTQRQFSFGSVLNVKQTAGVPRHNMREVDEFDIHSMYVDTLASA